MGWGQGGSFVFKVSNELAHINYTREILAIINFLVLLSTYGPLGLLPTTDSAADRSLQRRVGAFVFLPIKDYGKHILVNGL